MNQLLNIPTLNILLLRLILVLVIGGVIGAERELRSKSAGFRTITLICMGSFLFSTFSQYFSPQSPDRIASNIVTGIGFIGAGVIFKSENRVNGLTTAACIWLTAVLGMGVATGLYAFVFFTTALMLIALYLMVRMEILIDRFSQMKTYRICLAYNDQVISEIESLMVNYQLRSHRIASKKELENVEISWNVKGKEKDHHAFIEFLLASKSVLKLNV
jgi:putative Mg2+ transporter-C (MgtC) family protein